MSQLAFQPQQAATFPRCTESVSSGCSPESYRTFCLSSELRSDNPHSFLTVRIKFSPYTMRVCECPRLPASHSMSAHFDEEMPQSTRPDSRQCEPARMTYETGLG